MKTIVGERSRPALGDRYLARTGFDAQQTDQPLDPERPRQPFRARSTGDRGAHGPFDDQARGTSIQYWIMKNRGLVALAGLGAAAAAALGISAIRS